MAKKATHLSKDIIQIQECGQTPNKINSQKCIQNKTKQNTHYCHTTKIYEQRKKILKSIKEYLFARGKTI